MSKASPSPLFFSRSRTDAASGAATGSSWTPNTDLYATEGGLVVTVELAGMRREDLDLAVDGQRMIISGNRFDEARDANSKFLVMEINYGEFESVIDIPDGYDLTKAKAMYQNGFLRVEIPATGKSSRRRKIPVSDD
jgi:HSP20 family protein